MSKRILLSTILFISSFFYASAQCPVGIEANLINIVNEFDGSTSFDVELTYITNNANNVSIRFDILVCGEKEGILTTACYENIQTSQSPYTSVISSIDLNVPAGSDICVTYKAFNSPFCGGSSCNAIDNNEVPVLNALPVDLISFDGKLERNNTVSLNWATASEEQNDYFTVERSTDGRNFNEVGKVDGKGFSNTENYYSIIDESPKNGDNYYRLKQTNLDGSFEYFKVILIDVPRESNTGGITIYPTISKDEVYVNFDSELKQNSTIKIFNMNGEFIRSLIIDGGIQSLSLDISTLEPGMYIIQTPVTDTEFNVERFVKI